MNSLKKTHEVAEDIQAQWRIIIKFLECDTNWAINSYSLKDIWIGSFSELNNETWENLVKDLWIYKVAFVHESSLVDIREWNTVSDRADYYISRNNYNEISFHSMKGKNSVRDRHVKLYCFPEVAFVSKLQNIANSIILSINRLNIW